VMVRNIEQFVQHAIRPAIGCQLAAAWAEAGLARVRHDFDLVTIGTLVDMAAERWRPACADLAHGLEYYRTDPLSMLGQKCLPVHQQDGRQPEANALADPKHGAYYRTSSLSKGGVPMTAAPIRTFKDLLVWQKAMDLSVEVYRLTKNYPSHERYGLTAETRKTSRSVPYNIAEGHKRASTAEYIRFLGIAVGSAGELETQLLLAGRLGYHLKNSADAVFALHAEVERMLDALVRSLKAKISAEH